MAGIEFDAGDMEALTRGLEESAEALRVEVDAAITKTGLMIREEAEGIVRGHSKSIHVKMTRIPGAAIIEGAADNSPLARLYEKGNSKAGGKGFDTSRQMVTGSHIKQRGKNAGMLVVEMGKSFRHPVFGNQNVWVDQQRFPFLAPARRLVIGKAKPIMDAAWQHALEPLRRKV